MNDNSKVNSFLCFIIGMLCVVIGVLSYMLYSDDKNANQADVRAMATAPAPVLAPAPEPIAPVTGKVPNKQVIKKVTASDSTEELMIGNLRSHVYHYPNCADVERMNLKNIIHITANDAKVKGYHLHRGCPKRF